MIKGKQKNILSKELILSKISTYDIYRFYQGPFKVNNICVNKYRGEKNPSLIISSRVKPTLTHKDFGDARWKGDAFNFVEQIFNCDFHTALKIIDRDFGLGIQGGGKVKQIITWETPEIEVKKPPFFQVIYYSKMSKEGLKYWARFEQGEDDLKRERIYQPKEIWRNRRKISMGNLLTFGYYYEDIDRWKIYRPFAPKREVKTPLNQWKWDSNVPFDYVDNIKSINGDCSLAVLAKSKKDRMVQMKALQTDCIADVQAEDAGCLTFETLETLKSVPNRYIVADNDKKGKEFSWWLTKQHGFKHVNVPDKYLHQEPKCTDFADLCYHYGIQAVTDYFKQKGII